MISRLRFAILLFTALICFASCSKSRHDLLAKRWKIKEMIAGTPEAIESEQLFPELAAEIRAKLNYNFHPDGTLEVLMNDKIKQNGTWSLDDSGNKLSLHISGKEEEEWTITDLQSKSLSVTEKNKTKTIYIPK